MHIDALHGSALVQPLDNFGQLLQSHGLCQEKIESTRECLLLRRGAAQTSQCDDSGWSKAALLLPAPDLSRGFEAVQARHVDIHQDLKRATPSAGVHMITLQYRGSLRRHVLEWTLSTMRADYRSREGCRASQVWYKDMERPQGATRPWGNLSVGDLQLAVSDPTVS